MRKIYTQEKFSFSIFEDDKLINILRDKYKIPFTLEDDKSASFEEEKILTIDLSDLEYIASGSNGSVFGLDNEHSILKLTANVEELNYYKKLYDIYKGDKSILQFVKIPEIYKVFNTDTSSFYYLCFMDRLNEIDFKYDFAFINSNLQHLKDLDELFDSIKTNDELAQDEKERLITFIYNVNKLCHKYGFYDAYIENIMQDDDGNFFVIDLMME